MVSKSDRRRRLERERWERHEQRRVEATQRARRRRRLAAKVGAGGVAVVLLVAVAVWLYEGSGDATTTPAASSPSPGAICSYPDTGDSAGPAVDVPPADPGDLRGTWTATLQVAGGPITVQLFAEQAPCTVNSLRYLAEHDYFDGTKCHRLTTGESLKVLQCGDPTTTGTGGPGYQFATENTEGATYPTGTVAMARSSDPNSNGSQFFLVYGDSSLPPDYTVFGKITSGLDTLQAIAAKGTADASPDGSPKAKVVLNDLVVAHT